MGYVTLTHDVKWKYKRFV